MLIDDEYLKELFLQYYGNGHNAITAFDKAMKRARREPKLLGSVDEVSAECVVMPREEYRELYEKQALYAAQDIKAHCKSMVCESCVFWREGTEGVFCELSAGEIPCAWEV